MSETTQTPTPAMDESTYTLQNGGPFIIAVNNVQTQGIAPNSVLSLDGIPLPPGIYRLEQQTVATCLRPMPYQQQPE